MLPGDDEEKLSARVLVEQEHKLYPAGAGRGGLRPGHARGRAVIRG